MKRVEKKVEKRYFDQLPNINQFIKEYQFVWWIVGSFLLLAYGIKVFNVSISHDTEAMMVASRQLYNSWYSMGRFGLMFLKKVLGTYWFNPYVASFLMFATMMVNSVVWTYLLYWIGGEKKKWMKLLWIFPTFFFTSTIMAEQSGFLLQSYEVNIALLMVGIAILCLFQAFLGTSKRKWGWIAIALICSVIAFSVYQSLVPLFTAGVAICFLVLYDRMTVEMQEQMTAKFYFKTVGKFITFFLIAFVLYQGVNKAVLNFLGMETTSYIKDQIMWGTLPAKQCIKNILLHVRDSFLGKGIFYNSINGIVVILTLGYSIFRMKRKEHCYILYCLAVIYCLISPFLMSLLMGNAPTARTQLLLPFVIGFFLQYLLVKVKEQEKKQFQYIYPVTVILVIFVTMNQSILTSRLYYTQYVQYKEDVRVAEKISDQIELLNLGEIPKEPIVFVGARAARKNPSCIPGNQLELIGKSFFEVSFGTEHGTWVMRNFMATLGYSYALPDGVQIAEAEQVAAEMPAWPTTGSVAMKNGIIIVKLS